MSDAYRFGVYSGGCQCGAVRFHATELLDNPHLCYCRMCQKAVGGFFAALIGVRHEHLTWTRGKPSVFLSSDHVGRGFCQDCGTPLFYQNMTGPHVSLTMGAFDEPHRIPILYQMGMEGKHPSLLALDAIEDCGTTEQAMTTKAVAIKASNRQHPDHDTALWPDPN